MRYQLRSSATSLAFLLGIAGAATVGWEIGDLVVPRAPTPGPAHVAAETREAMHPVQLAVAEVGVVSAAQAGEPPAEQVIAEPLAPAEDAAVAVAPAPVELPPVPEGPVTDTPELALVPPPLVVAEDFPPPAAPPQEAAEVAWTVEIPSLMAQPVVEIAAAAAEPEREPAAQPEPETVAATVAEPPAVAATPAPRALAHLASYRSQAAAEQGWQILRGKAKGLLAEADPAFVPVDLPKGRFVRLMARLPAGVDGAGLCHALQAAGLYCKPIKAAS